MKKIRSRISKMRDGNEKLFLFDITVKVEEALKDNDIQKVDRLNERLNGIFDGLSDDGQIIAKEISKRIMEVHNA